MFTKLVQIIAITIILYKQVIDKMMKILAASAKPSKNQNPNLAANNIEKSNDLGHDSSY